MFGCFAPVLCFLILKMDSCWGDLDDVSAKTATLVSGRYICQNKWWRTHHRALKLESKGLE